MLELSQKLLVLKLRGKKKMAQKLVSAANSLFVDECFEEALEKFDEAIKLDNTVSDFFSKRSNCKLKLEDYLGKNPSLPGVTHHPGAMQDAVTACKLDPNCPVAKFRKGYKETKHL